MKDVDYILKQIIVNILDNAISIENINDNTNLIMDLKFHSMLSIRLLVEIEKEFDIEFDEEILSYELFEKYENLRSYVLSNYQSNTL